MAAEVKYVLSGGENNTDPNASLGGKISTKAGGVITSAAMNNVFDNVSGEEGKAGDVEYRGIYVKNTGATTLFGAKVWIKSDATSASDATAIALASEAVNEAMGTIKDESTAPSGPTFSAPSKQSEGLSIGDIPAGQFKGIWVRRTITAGAAAEDEDTFTIRAEGETGA